MIYLIVQTDSDRGDQLHGGDERHSVRHQELPLGVLAGDGSDGLDPGEHAGGAEQQVSGHYSRYRGGALLREPLLNSHYIYLLLKLDIVAFLQNRARIQESTIFF